jgi:hypothetical protein
MSGGMHRRVANVLLVIAVVMLFAGVLTAAAESKGYLPRAAGAPRFVGIGGLAFLSVATSLAANVFPYVVRGREAVGHVVEVLEDEGDNFPVVRYVVGVSEYEIRSSISYSRLRVGDEVRVLYLAENPRDGCIRYWSHLYLPPLVFAGIACVPIGLWLAS